MLTKLNEKSQTSMNALKHVEPMLSVQTLQAVIRVPVVKASGKMFIRMAGSRVSVTKDSSTILSRQHVKIHVKEYHVVLTPTAKSMRKTTQPACVIVVLLSIPTTSQQDVSTSMSAMTLMVLRVFVVKELFVETFLDLITAFVLQDSLEIPSDSVKTLTNVQDDSVLMVNAVETVSVPTILAPTLVLANLDTLVIPESLVST